MEISNRSPFTAEAVPLAFPGGGTVLTVIVKATFDIRSNGEVVPAGNQIPVAYGDECFDEKKGGSVKFESDIVPFKPRTDIVLVGKAHAPGGRPAPSVDAAIRVGKANKVVRVFGERRWICDGQKLTGAMTEPVPFVTMDLVPERAFGGMDGRTGGICVENPQGRGYFDQEIVEDPEKAFLPNIENPKHLIRHWKDHPPPAGLGVVGKGVPNRRKHLGTFDERWRKERCPELPADFRPDFYNCAQPDLQAEGFLKGDEEVHLVNLTPQGNTRFRLPGVHPIVGMLKTEGRDCSSIRELIGMNQDTLCLLPDEGRFFMVWRGNCPIMEMNVPEVTEIAVEVGGIAASEKM